MTKQTDLVKKIKMLLANEGITITELAKRMGVTQATVSNKIRRDSFSEKDLLKIAAACDAKLEITFVAKDGTRI